MCLNISYKIYQNSHLFLPLLAGSLCGPHTCRAQLEAAATGQLPGQRTQLFLPTGLLLAGAAAPVASEDTAEPSTTPTWACPAPRGDAEVGRMQPDPPQCAAHTGAEKRDQVPAAGPGHPCPQQVRQEAQTAPFPLQQQVDLGECDKQ